MDLVQSEAASELDPSSSSSGPTELSPHGKGLADAGGTVGGVEVASALKKSEDSAAAAGVGGGGLVELG